MSRVERAFARRLLALSIVLGQFVIKSFNRDPHRVGRFCFVSLEMGEHSQDVALFDLL